MAVPREPSSRGGDASSVSSHEKTKIGNPVPAVPISIAPPTVDHPEVSNVEQPPLEKATQASGSVPTSDKGKRPTDVQTVNFTLPLDFMADDVLDRARIFTHLGKYLLPHFKGKFKEMTIDDVGSHVSGLAFMVLEVSGLQTADLQTRLHVSCEILKGTREELAQVTLVENEKEIGVMMAREAEQKAKLEEMEEELKSIEACTRWMMKATIMRRHLTGKNPLANAAEDLKIYLADVGNENDLDSEDEKDVEVVEVDEEEAKVDETPVGDVSTSQPIVDAPVS
ncbi:hypothetical protein L6452_32488 [Arctium lappa]|uniref:Uncharacterized protein n=1 Tax=Arctium lappa TaxID=4217 RepID=A0ACB8Z543_ARCLA|nr:hypothetical protein L6452_32488 [Arctium lappa]